MNMIGHPKTSINIYICNVCLGVYLFVCPNITQEPLYRFVSNFDFKHSGEPQECY